LSFYYYVVFGWVWTSEATQFNFPGLFRRHAVKLVKGKREATKTSGNLRYARSSAVSVQRRQAAITCHAVNLFPDLWGRVSVSRLVKATRSNDSSCSQKSAQACCRGTWWCSPYPVYRANRTATVRPSVCLFVRNYSKSK